MCSLHMTYCLISLKKHESSLRESFQIFKSYSQKELQKFPISYIFAYGTSIIQSEREELRRLQRNWCGSSDYARVTCLLMLDKGYWGMPGSSQPVALQQELRTHIYTDAKSVKERIKSSFGVEYTSQGVVNLLNRLSFTYKKTTEVPCEADASLRKASVEELTETPAQMEEGSVVYYADGVHPTHDSRSTYVWIETGKRMEHPEEKGG